MHAATEGRLEIDVSARVSPVTPGGDRDLSRPLHPEIGVIALVPDTWGPQWQVRQHVLTRLAEHFHVVWMNPPRHWRELWRAGNSPPDGDLPPGFIVYTPPVWLTRTHRFRFLSRWSLGEQLRHARSLLTARGVKRIVLYLWRPEYADALSLGRYDLTCYHIDDEYSFSLVEVETSAQELQVLETVDQVFIHSPALMEKKGRVNPRTEVVPLGVDYAQYAATWPEPPDLASIPRPRIGYVGVLKKTLDWPLLTYLSGRHPEWSFVLLGPRGPHEEIQEPLRELEGRSNVHVLPGRPTRELAAYPQHLDVCIMPYVLNDYARYGYPLKCHEYLAGGRPVVGARMRTLEGFEDVMMLAVTPEEWEQSIQKALSPDLQGAEQMEARRAVARDHDWKGLVERIAVRMESQLRERGRVTETASHSPMTDAARSRG